MQKKKNGNCNVFPDGKDLNMFATAIANIISDKFTNDELGVLALFFSMISDSLATIAAANAIIYDEDTPTLAEEIL